MNPSNLFWSKQPLKSDLKYEGYKYKLDYLAIFHQWFKYNKRKRDITKHLTFFSLTFFLKTIFVYFGIKISLKNFKISTYLRCLGDIFTRM